LTAFTGAQQGGRWTLDLVADLDGMARAVGELHKARISQICIDPKPDGSDGMLMNVSDAYAACQSLL
jgi:hypothetical protein